MEKKQNTVVEFVKNNKAILIGTTAVVVGAIGTIVLGKKYDLFNTSKVTSLIRSNDIRFDQWGVGKLKECWRESGYINGIVTNLTYADIGNLGEEFRQKLGDIPSDRSVSIMIGIPDISES